MKKIFAGILILVSTALFSQEIKGFVADENNEPLIGVRVETDQGAQARTDFDGNFKIQVGSFPVLIKLSFMSYDTQTIELNETSSEMLKIQMTPIVTEVQGVIVSASRREQKIETVSVSLEIIKPELIENKGLTNVEEAVNQAPGAYAMDGSISIRGGSGFSYGAGSRSMVVWNDVPLLSGDAGDAKWQSIPLENISQIEVLKGASSVLYGSGALNGIVSIRDKEPTSAGETSVSYQSGIFDNPRREGLKWNDSPLMLHQLNAFHGKMHENVGYTASVYGLIADGHRAGEIEQRGRINGGIVYKPPSLPKVRTGLNFSFNQEKRGLFIVWESDSLGYNPQNGVEDPFAEESSLTINYGRRIIVDPYVKWYDPYDNKHSFQNRAYYTLNESEGTNQSAAAYMLFSDYKFERKFQNDLILVTGLSGSWNLVQSELYGDHTSENYSVYGQLEKNIGRFDFTFGMRGEYFQQNDLRPDSYTYFNSDSSAAIPIRPIFRAGTHYQVLEHTHLRVSAGQAFRYPSVAERFASTSVGALNIFPNHDLMPERGWSAEVGIKQGFRIKDFKGFIDVSAFINQYDNMMEFTFGFYEPDSIDFLNDVYDPSLPQNIVQQFESHVQSWLGFRAENAESARIAGAELSINGTGNIGPVKVTTIMGYTYMNPVSLNRDSVYVYGQPLGPEALGLYGGGFSDTSSSMLKYRFNHLVKGDVQFDYKKFSFGFSGRYNSFMKNIDGIFEQTIGEDIEILPGLKDYRDENNRGDMVFDTRLGYRINDTFMVHFIVNNLFNREYMTRPGDIRGPRQFMLRLHAKF